MAPKSTCVDGALEVMSSNISSGTGKLGVDGSNLGDKREWIPVRVWLHLIRTFIILILSWSNTNEVVRDRLGDVVISIDNAFETAADEIADSMKEGDPDALDDVRIKLLNRVEILKPRIRESYGFLIQHILKKTANHLPITDSEVWVQFCSSLILASRFLSTPMLLQIEGIVASLQAFGEAYLTRVSILSDCKPFRCLNSYFECVAISVARLVFLWQADETNDHDKAVMLNNALWDCSIMPKPFSGVQYVVKPEIVKSSEEIVGMRMQEVADVAKTPRNAKRPKISSLDFPSVCFEASTHGQIIGEVSKRWTDVEGSRKVSPSDILKDENVVLKQKIQDLEESLCREKCDRQKELEILRSEKASLETEIKRFRALGLM